MLLIVSTWIMAEEHVHGRFFDDSHSKGVPRLTGNAGCLYRSSGWGPLPDDFEALRRMPAMKQVEEEPVAEAGDAWCHAPAVVFRFNGD